MCGRGGGCCSVRRCYDLFHREIRFFLLLICLPSRTVFLYDLRIG